MAGSARFPALDIARTAALAAMVSYHFTYDLALFGLIPPAVPVTGFFAAYARAIAGTFLFLAGVSLVLAHGAGIRWRKVGRRVLLVGGAAAGVTAATWAAMPDRFVFWGILHAIAFASLAGLPFVRASGWVAAAAAAAVLAVWASVRPPAFDAAWLLWTGLGTQFPLTVDYVPVFPSFAAALAGIAAGKVLAAAGVWDRLATLPPPGPWVRALAWPGRHSLAVYLAHQPVLVGLLWAWTRL